MFLQLKDQFWVCITCVQIPGLQWLFFCIGKDLPDQLVKDLPIQPLLWKIKTQISLDNVKPWTRIQNLFPSLMDIRFQSTKAMGGLSFVCCWFPSSWPGPQFMQGNPEQRQDAKGPLMLMFGTWVWRDMAGPQPSPSWTFVLKLHSKKGLSADSGISAFRFYDENKVSSLGQLNYFWGGALVYPVWEGLWNSLVLPIRTK